MDKYRLSWREAHTCDRCGDLASWWVDHEYLCGYHMDQIEGEVKDEQFQEDRSQATEGVGLGRRSGQGLGMGRSPASLMDLGSVTV